MPTKTLAILTDVSPDYATVEFVGTPDEVSDYLEDIGGAGAGWVLVAGEGLSVNQRVWVSAHTVLSDWGAALS